MSPILNRLLVLESPQRLPDGAGGYTEVWQALGEVWAEVRAGTGGEGAGEALALSTLAVRITVRGAPEGTASRPRPGQRFREGNRRYRILAVAETGRSDLYLTCHAREEAAK